MRVLVTGHTGYIGSTLVPLLLRAGHEVVGLDSGLFERCVHGPEPLTVPALRSDLRDVVVEDLEGFDAVIHLAALSNDPVGDLDPELTHAINHRAATRLARLAKAAGVARFVYSSSCSVYGTAEASALVDETAPFAPVTAYAQSKVAVEADLHELADETFAPTSLRNATVYGWSPRPRLDLVLNDLVATSVLTGVAKVLSDGTPWRPIVHVADVATAFLVAIEAPWQAVHDRAFNVGSEDQNLQVRDIAAAVAGAVTGTAVEITGESGSDPRSYRVSFARIRDELGFRPVWTPERGAIALAAAFRDHGLNADDHRHRFKRLPWLLGEQRAGRVDAALRPTDVSVDHAPTVAAKGTR